LCESNWRVAELAGVIRERAGRGGRAPLTVPAPLWRAVVVAARAIDAVRPLRLATPQALRLLGEHFRFDARLAREELGWRPKPFVQVVDEILSARGVAAP
jgi:nucleoside-diphosphate-sugar epimerase